jgi:hypothetical protein
MATTVVSYTRGTTYISNISGGKTCYGLVGEMAVGGLLFETIERFSKEGLDFVHLKPQDYMLAIMYWHDRLGRVINPWAGNGPSKQQNNILIHRGTKPSHYEGCIGPGFLETKGSAFELTYAPESLEVIWETCGGAPGSKPGWSKNALQVVFRVTNEFPERSTLIPVGGSPAGTLRQTDRMTPLR